MIPAPVRNRLLLACGTIAFLVILIARGRLVGPPDADEGLQRAQAEITQMFRGWRESVEQAAAELSALAQGQDTSETELFEQAQRMVDRSPVDGVLVLDASERGVFWGGRSFELQRDDFSDVYRGLPVVGVLDHPAHRVIFAAQPAGRSAALAFRVFDERFSAELTDELAARFRLGHVRFNFGNAPTRPGADSEGGVSFYVPPEGQPPLCKITLRPQDPGVLEDERELQRRNLDALLVMFLLTGVLVFAWPRLRRPAPGSLWRVGLLVLALVLLRLVAALGGVPAFEGYDRGHKTLRLWVEPADSLFSSLVLLVSLILLARAARVPRPRPKILALALALLAACALAPWAYVHLIRMLVQHGDPVFNPLHVMPRPPAALALATVCLLTSAFFVLVRCGASVGRQLHRLAPLLYVGIVLAAMPDWRGAILATGSGAVLIALHRGGRPWVLGAVAAFAAALTSCPLVMEAAYEARVENIESYARTLVSEGRADRAFLILEGAAQECTDDIVGVDLAIATGISDGSDARNFAFQIWTAAGWPVGEACTVQVCDLKGDVLSSFDYDSPPEGWLPAPPRAGETEGFRTLRGRGKGAYIRFYVWDLPLKLGGVGVPGGVSVRGIARFAVPDRWDMLLANLRPAIFAEPLGGLASTGSELLLLANLNPDGTARRTGLQGGTLQGIDEELLERARRKGSASARMVHEDEPARVYVVPVAEGYAALVVADSRLSRATLALSKVLLIDAAVFGLFLLGLILFSGGPPSFLFAHRVALVLVLLSVPPVLLLAAYNTRVATERHEDEIRARLRWRLDLAATLLANTPRLEDVNDDWCATFAADYRADLNIYVDEELKATSRPGVWDTGLLADRLDAQAHVALNLRGRKAYDGPEPFGAGGRLFVSYRRIQGRWDGEVLVAAPALDDRIGLERRETGANALLLAAFMLTAMVIIFVALFLARTLTAPLERLRDATQRVAAGDFDAALPERRRDEFGELLRAFNSMTREIHDAQDLRVRAEKQAAWREMAKQIAHEIKNPLTPMKLTVQNLLASHREAEESFGENFEKGAQVILEQIDVLQRIATNFSAFAGFPARRPERLEVAAVVREAASLFDAAGETIVTEGVQATRPVMADRDELRRSLINLLTNARQAGATRIEVRTADEDEWVRIEVADDGCGMAPEVQARIFEPSFTTKTRGSGLGLPIVKRMVDDLEGRVEIHSVRGAGTTLVLRLPAADADQA